MQNWKYASLNNFVTSKNLFENFEFPQRRIKLKVFGLEVSCTINLAKH